MDTLDVEGEDKLKEKFCLLETISVEMPKHCCVTQYFFVCGQMGDFLFIFVMIYEENSH